MMIGQRYSSVKQKVFTIEFLNLIRAKTINLPLDELRDFVLQEQEINLDHNLTQGALDRIEAAGVEYIARVKSILDAEIGDRMKDLNVVPDNDND